MNSNVISLCDRRLDRLEGTVFGVSEQELAVTAILSRIAFCQSERQTVRSYIDVIDSGDIVVVPDDGSPPTANCLAHLGDLLSHYDDMLRDKLAELEYRRDALDGDDETD